MAWPVRWFAVMALFGATMAGEHPGCAEAMRVAEPLDVCDVLKDLSRYRGRVVAIRAEVNNALRPLKPCREPLLTVGYRWPDALAIDPSEEECAATREGDVPAGEFFAQLRKAERASKGSEGRLVVTVIGRVLAREEYVRVQTNYGLLANGYGHLGAFPAAMQIWVVRKPERLTVSNRDRTQP